MISNYSFHFNPMKILVLCIAGFTPALLASAPLRAQVPNLLNYQGRVTVGGTNLTTDAAQFKFALVNGDGTTFYWKNDGTTAVAEPSTSVSVAVSQGLYSLLLGDTTRSNMAPIPSSVFTNENVNLRVWFGTGTNGFVQLTPDQRIGAAGYALRAATVDNLTNVTGDVTLLGTLTARQIIGGIDNVVSSEGSVIAGGTLNDLAGEGGFIGAGSTNTITAGAANSVIGGGWGNFVSEPYSFVGGGLLNIVADADVSAAHSFIGGGKENRIGSDERPEDEEVNPIIGAVIVGGERNFASAAYTSVGGGYYNEAKGFGSTVSGGSENKVEGLSATVPGGYQNSASADDSFAAGVQAKATNIGSFVWSGTYGTATFSTNDYSFSVRAPGGVRFITTLASENLEIGGSETNGVALAPGSGSWTSLSDLNAKENFEPVDAAAILAKVAALPVMTWNYKAQADDIRHIGPTAQDFRKAFGIGESDTGITTVDADGVTMAAIQGLAKELKARDKIIEELKSKLETLEERLNSLPPAP